jgi:hypothetical protein
MPTAEKLDAADCKQADLQISSKAIVIFYGMTRDYHFARSSVLKRVRGFICCVCTNRRAYCY